MSLFPLERPKNPRVGLGCFLSEASFTGRVSVYCKPDPEIFRRLIGKCTFLGKEGEFSTCSIELQRNFLKCHPTKLKSLICLAKHW
ncbi:2'-5'-oligoadenylate synthase 1A [Lemmus lemmus]